jgi:hypothetical protein
MGRRHVVEQLNDEQFIFVIQSITNGLTDREIAVAFEKKFKGVSLAKSSLHRWRTSAGNELAEKYRFARFQAKQLLQDLESEDADKYQVIIQNIEDRLLAATREVAMQNPVRLLRARQEEERLRFKREELELKKAQLELEKEKLRGAALDRVKLGAEFLQDFLEYVGSNEDGIRFLSKNLQPFGEFLKAKYAPEN